MKPRKRTATMLLSIGMRTTTAAISHAIIYPKQPLTALTCFIASRRVKVKPSPAEMFALYAIGVVCGIAITLIASLFIITPN